MKHFYYTFLATVMTFTSCKNDDSKKVQATDGTIVPFTQQTSIAKSPQIPVVERHNLFRENNVVTASSSSAVGVVNPAHGQPNHRCDIPVGAPLNSAPNKSAATVSQTNVQPQATPIITSKMSTPKVVTAEGMNPPHGEKGHRCDIAVGAPLNSKPATNAAVSAPQPTPNSSIQYPVPALLSTSAAETKTLEEAKTTGGE